MIWFKKVESEKKNIKYTEDGYEFWGGGMGVAWNIYNL